MHHNQEMLELHLDPPEGECPPKPVGRRRAGREPRMWYVYLLRSRSHSTETYVGMTQDLRRRLAEHNAGKSPHTSKYRPWRLASYLAFPEKSKAMRFEEYLKTGSGRAFANRHLW